MILYNMRYRGPFEYDKFCLNVLQFYNEVQHLTHFELAPYKNSILELNNNLSNYLDEYENLNVKENYKTLIQIQEFL